MMELENCDVIVIDDDICASTSNEDCINKGNSDLEILEDLPTLFQKLFPDPVVDLSDRINVKDKKGSICSNVRCDTNDEQLVAPTRSAVSYFNLPSKRLLICQTCCNIADDFMKKMVGKFYNGESIYECRFPPTNPVVLIDSDGSDNDSEAEVLPGLSEEDSVIVRKAVEGLTKKQIEDYDLEQQLEVGKLKLDQTLERLNVNYKKLIDDSLAASNELYKSMQCLYDTFIPKTQQLEPLDIPFEEMRPSVLHRQKDKKRIRSVTAENQAIKNNVSRENNRVSLPLYPGRLMRPKPQAGQKFYVMKQLNASEWLPGYVVSGPLKEERTLPQTGLGDIYRVRIEIRHLNGPSSNVQYFEKEVSESSMAYFDPPTVQLALGTRVIAVFNTDYQTPKRYLAGLIAEPPSVSNKMRYLVFFDDGYTQYVCLNDIRVVVKSKPNVSEYFPAGGQRFIRDYFSTYPERPMLKINVMSTVKVMRKGIWHNTRVVEVDASLLRVLFLKENYQEWIYRGSTRLKPVFDHVNYLRGDLRKRICRGAINQHTPYIQYEVVTVDSDSDTEFSTAAESPVTNDEQPDKQRRAVAKKSTNRLPDTPSPPLPVRRYAKRITRQQDGKIETLIPSHAIQPLPFRKHSCSPECVALVKYDERKMKNLNPLIVPTLYGFRRDSDMNLIFYLAPCGKKLRSMTDVLKYTSETKILIGIDHFDFDSSVHIFDEFIVPPQHILMKDLSFGKENLPIPVVNSISALLPNMMEYMTERRGLEGVYLNLDENFLVGCDCTDNCLDKSKCSCQQMTIREAETWSKFFHIHQPEKAGYQYRRLPVGLPTGIWECNSKCKCCRKTCLNRVAQYPLKVKLQLFKTKKKGWGVRCLNDIPCGTFICVYNGNILTETNANEGGLRHGDEYFAELDYIECMEGTKANYEPTVLASDNEREDIVEESSDEFDPQVNAANPKSKSGKRKKSRKRKQQNSHFSDSEENTGSDDEAVRLPQSFDVEEDDDEDSLPFPSVRQLFGKDEAPYVMDAKTAGNIGRYFNHSCDPNVHVQSVFVDTHDLRFPWIAFFSQKYIKAGTELTWDYRYEPGKVPGKRLICYCGAANCRKRLL
ncbi:hypothetical protein O3M35_012964 [Rhynocoris fuscipes]|uniref:Histone-lysine N-methyltransferase eggless n=1 Tax=Rhynocoris fuscipes TaxID=488301 RepID=A0AAW1CHM4_9HEMI